MKNQETEQTAYQIAKKSVEFKIHLKVYIVANILFAIVNIIVSPDYFWCIWPLIGWGIGIVLHRREMNLPSKQSRMDRLIQEEMDKQGDSVN